MGSCTGKYIERFDRKNHLDAVNAPAHKTLTTNHKTILGLSHPSSEPILMMTKKPLTGFKLFKAEKLD